MTARSARSGSAAGAFDEDVVVVRAPDVVWCGGGAWRGRAATVGAVPVVDRGVCVATVGGGGVAEVLLSLVAAGGGVALGRAAVFALGRDAGVAAPAVVRLGVRTRTGSELRSAGIRDEISPGTTTTGTVRRAECWTV
jgi:hypothetical protein